MSPITDRLAVLTPPPVLPQLHSSKGRAASKTPLAIVQYDLDNKSFVNLYYLGTDGIIIRSKREMSNPEASWLDDEIKDSGRLPATSTSLNAIFNPTTKKVVLTYALKTGVMTCYCDKDKWTK
jgi:hypothetical protein